MRTIFGIKKASVILSATKWSRRISIFTFFMILVACTDYESMIDDDYEEWLAEQSYSFTEILPESSNSIDLSSSSSQKSSSSHERITIESSSSIKSSSSSKKDDKSSSSHKESSSCSSTTSDKSSSSIILSSDSHEETSSSSLVIVSSSSESVKSSSSGKASWAYLNPAISYGEMIDERDGQVYKTVVIGEQTWMAENLNFETESSYCYNDSAKYCDKYGRLYTWESAKNVCPTDWHLPTQTEWSSLLSTVKSADWLKSDTFLRLLYHEWNGIDRFGFSGILSGIGMPCIDMPISICRGYDYEGTLAHFWSSTESNEISAFSMTLDYQHQQNDDDIWFEANKSGALSIRCIKGSLIIPNSSSSNVTVTSSGSEPLAAPCKTFTEDNCEYGELKDDRDGQTYKTVKIGSQWWMAENLRYGKKVRNGSELKDDEIVVYFCYEYDMTKCAKYGGLYLWAEAMNLPYNCNDINCSALIDSNGDGIHQGICPQGWHMPSQTEWGDLFNAVGEQSVVGRILKSTTSWSTNCSSQSNGLDTYGFSALPAGYSSGDGNEYFNEGQHTFFWTTKELSSYQAININLACNSNGSYLTTYHGKSIGQSIRCIKD